ncbi:MAG: HEAT repeat domain-containing protein, partial [Halobacteriota archaeon]
MLELLIRQLESKDPITRTKAAVALGNSGERGAVLFLAKALGDENRHVRRAASAA